MEKQRISHEYRKPGKKPRIRTLILIAVVLVLGFMYTAKYSDPVYGQAAGTRIGSEVLVAGFDVNMLRVDDSTEVLLVVQSNGETANATGELFVYSRDRGADGRPGQWKEEILFEPVKLGRKGMGKTREGDGKTPLGIFQMNTPFGIKPKAEGFPGNYLQVTDSMYWDGDQSSPTYNQLVDRTKTTAFNPKDSEHLTDYVPYYNYALNIGYNPKGTKGAGSALFLHCLGPNRENTGGCIAVSEKIMEQVLRLYREKKTTILIANKGGFSKYYYNWAEEFGVPSPE